MAISENDQTGLIRLDQSKEHPSVMHGFVIICNVGYCGGNVVVNGNYEE